MSSFQLIGNIINCGKIFCCCYVLKIIYKILFKKNLRSGRTGQWYLVHLPGGHAHGVLVCRVTAPERLDERGSRLAAPDHMLLALLLLHLQREAGAEDSLLNRQYITTLVDLIWRQHATIGSWSKSIPCGRRGFSAQQTIHNHISWLDLATTRNHKSVNLLHLQHEAGADYVLFNKQHTNTIQLDLVQFPRAVRAEDALLNIQQITASQITKSEASSGRSSMTVWMYISDTNDCLSTLSVISRPSLALLQLAMIFDISNRLEYE